MLLCWLSLKDFYPPARAANAWPGRFVGAGVPFYGGSGPSSLLPFSRGTAHPPEHRPREQQEQERSLLLSAVFAGGRVRSLLRPRKGFSATTITWRSLTSPRLASFARHPTPTIASIPSPGVRYARVNPIRAGSLYRGLRPFMFSTLGMRERTAELITYYRAGTPSYDHLRSSPVLFFFIVH